MWSGNARLQRNASTGLIVLWTMIVAIVATLSLFAGCMRIQIDAKEGSRVTVTQQKPVDVKTDTTATIPDMVTK